MAIDSAGVNWFAGEAGVSRFAGNTWTTFTAVDGLASDLIRSVAIDQKGAIWFGAGWGGISKYVEGSTSVEENTKVPAVMGIRGNFPNPFNSSTTIEFSLYKESFVKLDIFNISGQKINTLFAENLPAGVHSVRWDGRNSRGMEVPTGIYLAKLQMGKTIASHRMVLIK
ncbi:MAG: T9SS type A sorting domain-containing protein [bacterium]|nr:MAG: T9SS type A sorting domain-containing protein [bacterium]